MAETLVERLTPSQRDIMLGHMVDIPPEEADELVELGLKGREFFVGEGDDYRMVWPITDKGLKVRQALAGKEG